MTGTVVTFLSIPSGTICKPLYSAGVLEGQLRPGEFLSPTFVSFNKALQKVDLPLIMVAWARSMQVAFLIPTRFLCLAKKRLRLTILQHPQTNEWPLIPVIISQIHGLQAFASNNLRRQFVMMMTGTNGHLRANCTQRRKPLFLKSSVRNLGDGSWEANTGATDFGSTPFDYSPHAQPLLSFDDFFS